MILRHIQAGEVVVVILDFRSFKNIEAHAGKNVDHFILHQRQGMQSAQRQSLSGQGDIHLLPAVAGSQLKLVHLCAQGLVLFFHQYLKLIDDFAHSRPVFLCHGTQTLHQIGDGTLFAQKLLPEGCQLFLCVDLADLLFHLFLQCLDLLLHVLHSRAIMICLIKTMTGDPLITNYRNYELWIM